MRCSRRAGKSLVEALVIISLMSVIMGLAATSLASLFRLRYVITRDAEQAASLDRLSMRLRLDAHEANSVAVDNGCILNFADGRSIQYFIAAPRIVREVRRVDQVAHRDTFSLPRHTVVTFEEEAVATGQLVRILVKPEETKLPPRELPRAAVIEAAVGIHGSLAKAEAR
jgi:Tfp pilus assembly protein FimT